MSRDPFRLGSRQAFPEAASIGTVRESVLEFVEDHPVWMAYLRTDRRFPCTSQHGPSQSTLSRCERCLGTGYKVRWERHAVRPVYRPSTDDLEAGRPGMLWTQGVTIHTPRKYYPARTDLYIDVEWNVTLADIPRFGRPNRILDVYRIDAMAVMREDEVSFFTLGCQPTELDRAWFEAQLLQATFERTV